MSESANTRLEKKVDALMSDIASIKSILNEREKSEVLRSEIVIQAMKTQDEAIKNVTTRVDKLEDLQNKVIWLIVSAVLLAVIGTVIGVNIIK